MMTMRRTMVRTMGGPMTTMEAMTAMATAAMEEVGEEVMGVVVTVATPARRAPTWSSRWSWLLLLRLLVTF